MRGNIGLTHLKIHCVVGVYPSERLKKQTLFVDVSLQIDFSACSKKDALKETVDYSSLSEELSKLAVRRKYRLLETFAVEALDLIFNRWSLVSQAEIRIQKPSAVPGADSAFATLERQRA